MRGRRRPLGCRQAASTRAASSRRGEVISRAHDWELPGAFAVAAGVHRIPLPLPGDRLRAVNVYAIADGGGLTLIDSGWALAEARTRLEQALAGIGHELGDVTRFLVTHVHRDHYTLAITARRLFGSRILLGAGEQDTLDLILDRAEPAGAVFGRLLLRSGAGPVAGRLRDQWRDRSRPQEDEGEWEKPDEWLAGGEAIAAGTRTLRAIATPGHTRGHLVFTDEQAGLLFAGDHVLPHITPSIGFEAARPPLPLGDYLASLRLVRSMPDLRLLPAHGSVTESTHARIDELLAHHAERLDAAAAVIASLGEGTAYEAARMLTWTRREHHFDDLDAFNQMLAVFETAAHLDVLVSQGRLTSEVAAGVLRYAG